MSKYQKLTLHLGALDAGKWMASFDEIEEVLGTPLPESARAHQAWWANQRRAQSLAWELAGWKTSAVDLANERVTFIYDSGEVEPDEQSVRRLSIAEAKAGLAANFGVSTEAVEITIRG